MTSLRELLVCVAGPCGGPLAPPPRVTDYLRCRACGAVYPVLAGVPVVVPSPMDYLASYRDPVLATLAELGAATPAAVALVDQFAAPARGRAEPLGFGDDWTVDEGDAARPPAATADATIAGWLAAVPDPSARLAAAVPADADVVVEVGCGGNLLARQLARRGRTVVVADLSFRAVARTVAATGALGVVVDAAALPFGAGTVDAVVAANLLDLLDEPGGFVAGAVAALAPAGALILSTPDPALGTDEPGFLAGLLADHGLTATTIAAGVPWLRAHSSRYFQLYFADLVVGARPVSGRGRRGRGRGRGRSPARARGRARRPSP
ncbi:MAG: methyltransferase domain-containing protein [Kofleriaceae bacterium]